MVNEMTKFADISGGVANLTFIRRGTFRATAVDQDTCADWRGAMHDFINFLFHDGDRLVDIWLPADSPSIEWAAT